MLLYQNRFTKHPFLWGSPYASPEIAVRELYVNVSASMS